MPDGEQQLTTTSSSSTSSTSENRNESGSFYITFLYSTMYVVEILLIILLAITSYASLQKGALKVQLQPPPVPLFSSNSTVRDFYGGDVATPFSAVIASDVSLVMYYTPWDFDSQMAKNEFESVANEYQGQIYATAINCWVHTGACRQTFPKLRTFPLILGYVGGSKGIQYRGPLQYPHIAKFVQHLLKPLERVENAGDLYRILAKSTAVVTGYFNFSSSKPVGFHSFYLASLRFLEYDPHKSIQFALVTNDKAATRVGVRAPHPSFDIRLHLWNETLIYPHNGSSIDVSRFLQWIYYRSHSPVQWIWPSGRKSQVVQHFLIDQQRPALVLFTPELRKGSASLVVREVALDYNNCGSSPRMARLIQEIQTQREKLEAARLSLENQCSVFEKPICRSTSNVSSLLVETSCWPPSTTIPRTLPLSIQGLACKTNRTLNFFLMDSDQYPNYLRQLGDLRPDVAVIIDPQDESHYVLRQSVTRENVEQLIINYTQNSLKRFRRSVDRSKPCQPGRVCIRSISANEFEAVVLNPTQDVLVLYRKKGCVFCDVAARTFLRLSLMLSPSEMLRNVTLPLSIQLVTIEAEENDLPWQYTVDRYPTIIFYPAFSKMDSRAFPADLELNAINLLNFTLSRLSVRKRVAWFIHFCKDAPCLTEAQRRISAQIGAIDQHIRSLRHRLYWLPSASDHDGSGAMINDQLRRWIKERRFWQELSHAVLRVVSELVQRRRRDLYPEGIRLVADD